ncbi:MAG TPA: TolC family protein, partial [Pseudomonadales bacterium]|nr:TolC family protein [Pseudomonadales bacterium]
MHTQQLRLFIFLLLANTILPSHAEELTLEKAASLAVSYHPFIQSRIAEQSAANSELTAANNQFLPSFSVSALRGDSGAAQRSATISQPLWTGGRLTGLKARAKANVDAAKEGIIEAEQSILSETVARFSELYRAEKSLVIAK